MSRNLPPKTCPVCNHSFIPWKDSQIYCSQECYWSKGQQTATCQYCGIVFKEARHILDSLKRHYCSRQCRNADRENRRKKIYLTHICEQCGIEFTKEKRDLSPYSILRFCTIECHHEWQKNGGNPKGKEHPSYCRVEVPCDNCGKILIRRPYRLKDYDKQFCNKKCYGEWKTKNWVADNHPRFTNVENYRGPNLRRQNRRARARDKYTCQYCGKTEKELGRRLDVHHIVPFKEFNYVYGENENYKKANRLSNLISLCNSCHHVIEHNPDLLK